MIKDFVVYDSGKAGDGWQDKVKSHSGVKLIEERVNPDTQKETLFVEMSHATAKDLIRDYGVSAYQAPPEPCLIGPFALGASDSLDDIREKGTKHV